MNRLLDIKAFEGVKETTLDHLWQEGTERDVRTNQILIHAHEPVPSLYFILKGKVIYYNLTKAGKRKIIFILGEGALINETITRGTKPSIYCETIEPCRIFQVDKLLFQQLMMKDRTLMEAAFRMLETKLSRAGHQLKNTMGSIYLERKLAAKLWKLARDFGVDTPEGRMIDINMSMTFLGDLMGAPRETTSRLCKTLTDYGLISIKKRKVYIPDVDRLSKFYCEGLDGV